MSAKQTEMWELLCELDSETVLQLLTDWHGLQILDDGFYGHLIDEGYIEGAEEEDESESRALAIQDEDFLEYCKTFENCWLCPLRGKDVAECGEQFNELVGSAEGRAKLRGEDGSDD